MSNSIIQVSNLSKSYVLKHQSSRSYIALRDVIADKAKSIIKKQNSFSSTKEEFLALNNVSFEIRQGDRVGIIGRNGAGKSTLLKIISRIVTPTKGRIVIDGRVASLLEVGTGFHPELSGRENIFLNGSILGMSKTEIKDKFDEIVAFAEVEKFLDTPVKRYSSGMYVRLAFAVAAHLESEILIVDEVLAVGDAEFQKKCLGKMKDVTGQGRTVLFVSHNMDAVQKLCNKGLLLQKGKLISDGTIDDVVKQYLETSDDSQAFYEIEKPIDFETLPGYVEKIAIEDEHGKPINEIAIGDKWQVRVRYTINKNTEDFVCGMGLQTLLGISIRTSWSEPKNVEKGVYEAVFKNNDLMLTDGQYKLIIGLSHQQRTFHYIDNVVYITISEVSNLKDNNRIVNTKSGLILNQMPIAINKI